MSHIVKERIRHSMAVNTNPRTEVFAGLVERVTFHNEENGFCVLRVKARGKRDLVTVVGHAAVISAGEFIQASGDWNNDRQHGVQFRARFLKAMPPTTIEGIEKYLGSGMIRGIGPVYARKLVQAFGEQVFDIIEAEPHRLREVAGIGPKRAEGIVAGWAEQRVIREIMIFLHANGVGTSRAVRIYKTYGTDAVQLISENPYRLGARHPGYRLRTADAIAMKLGIEKTAMIRARAGISYALTEALDDGHCGLPRDELMPLAVKLLEIPDTIVLDALRLELDAGQVIADQSKGVTACFSAGLYRAERSIVSRLRSFGGRCPGHQLMRTRRSPGSKHKPAWPCREPEDGDPRRAASKVMVITGGPGVGKTTLVNAILRILAAKHVSLLLCAPTGRAAKRMTDTTGREAKTIHRLLEINPKTGDSARTRKIRSNVICSWSMRPPWSTCS